MIKQSRNIASNETNSSSESVDFNISDLLIEVKESGHVDLRDISKMEAKNLADYYRSNFSALEESDKIEFLEQLMLIGELTDEEGIDYVSKIDPESREAIGLFIYQSLDSIKFLKTFYECWSDINSNDRYRIQKDILTNRQEVVILIAPFINLNNYYGDGVYIGAVERGPLTRRGDPVKTRLLHKQFYDFDKSSALINNLLDFIESHDEKVNDCVILNLLSLDKILLIPYLKRIEKLDIFTPEELKSLKILENNYFSSDLFMTSAEHQEMKKIFKDLEPYYPKTDLTYAQATEISPRKIGVRLADIHDRSSLRKAEIFLSNFTERSQELGKDKIEYLIELAGTGISIFSQIENLGLTNLEIKTLFDGCVEENSSPFGMLENWQDLKEFVRYSREHFSETGPDLEKLLVSHIIENLEDDEAYGAIGNKLNLYTEDFFAIFKDSDRQKIIAAVSRYAPSIWLNNLSYVLEHQIMTLDDLINKTTDSGSNFIDNFNKISYHLRLLENQGQPADISLTDLNKKVKAIFYDNPTFFLNENCKSIIDRLYTPDEQHQFILEQLTVDLNPYFFSLFLGSPLIKNYADVFRQALEKNGSLLLEITNNDIHWICLKGLINNHDLLNLILKNLEYIDTETVFSDMSFLFELGKNPTKANLLTNRLAEANNFSAMALLNQAIDDFNNRKVYLEEEIKKRNLQINYKNRQHFTSHDLDWNKKQITRMELELAGLENSDYDIGRKNLTEIQARNLLLLNELCEKNRFFVFSDSVIETKGLDVTKYILRDLYGYLTIKPEFLFAEDYRDVKGEDKYLCLNILGSEKFNTLVLEYKRLLAFKSGFHHTTFNQLKIKPEIQEAIKEVNPLIDIFNQGLLSKDYYLTVMDFIVDTPFSKLYESELRKIVDDKNKLDGPRLKVEYFEPEQKFQEMAERIFLLSSHPKVVEHAQWIMALPKEQQAEIVKLLEFSLLNKLSFLGAILESENFEEISKELQENIEGYVLYAFNMDEIDNLSFQNLTIDSIGALITYYYKTCKKNNHQEMVFKDFLKHALDGTYQEWRQFGNRVNLEAKEKLLENLQAENLIPKNLKLEQYQIWSEENKLDFDEVFDFQIEDLKQGIRDLMGLAIADEHISLENLDTANLDGKYNNLIEPLRLLSERQKELRNLLNNEGLTTNQENEYKQLTKKIIEYRADHNSEIDKILALKYLDGLKKMSPHNLENQTITIDRKTHIPLKKVFSTLEKCFKEEFPDFISDISRIRQLIGYAFDQIYGNQKIHREKLHLTDKVDLETYVLIGERPVVSCQNYNGSSRLNGGLLSYLVDPNVKIIQIYNDSGNIIARSVLRIMADKNGDPQLFLERVYSTIFHHKINEAITNFAKLKARDMGVGLYTKELKLDDEKQSSELGVNILHNNNSRSAYVYTDAGGGVIPKGKFSVRNPKLISNS